MRIPIDANTFPTNYLHPPFLINPSCASLRRIIVVICYFHTSSSLHAMFGSALRRGATIASRNATRSLATTTSIRSILSLPFSSRVAFTAPSLRRCFITTAISRQQYAAQEQRYDGDEDAVSETVLPGEGEADATRFEQLGERKLVHPALLRAVIGDMGLTEMTQVQTETLNAALTGRDV
jgi:hypothetical protein